MRLEDFIPTSLMGGDEDAISLLSADQDKVRDLFKQFDEIKDSRASRQKEKIVAAACRELKTGPARRPAGGGRRSSGARAQA